MPIDTLMVYAGVYDRVEDAEADYQLVKELHTEAGLIDAYDAAVIERREGGKTKIVKKHETPTRVGGVLGGGVGLATGLVVALFPFAAVVECPQDEIADAVGQTLVGTLLTKDKTLIREVMASGHIDRLNVGPIPTYQLSWDQPHEGNLFREKVAGAVFVGNAFGKLAGSTQVQELGTIESPIVLTNTLSVGTAVEAVVRWTIAQPGNEDVRSVNALVGETNDGGLNDIRGLHVTRDHVTSAIASARASATRCCWPPDSWCGRRSSIAWSSPMRSISSQMRIWRSGARRSRPKAMLSAMLRWGNSA